MHVLEDVGGPRGRQAAREDREGDLLLLGEVQLQHGVQTVQQQQPSPVDRGRVPVAQVLGERRRGPPSLSEQSGTSQADPWTNTGGTRWTSA